MQKQLISIRNTVTTTPTPAPYSPSPISYCLPVEYCLPVDYCLPVKYCLFVDYLGLCLVYQLWDSLKTNIIFLNHNAYSIMIRKINIFSSCIHRKFLHQSFLYVDVLVYLRFRHVPWNDLIINYFFALLKDQNWSDLLQYLQNLLLVNDAISEKSFAYAWNVFCKLTLKCILYQQNDVSWN